MAFDNTKITNLEKAIKQNTVTISKVPTSNNTAPLLDQMNNDANIVNEKKQKKKSRKLFSNMVTSVGGILNKVTTLTQGQKVIEKEGKENEKKNNVIADKVGEYAEKGKGKITDTSEELMDETGIADIRDLSASTFSSTKKGLGKLGSFFKKKEKVDEKEEENDSVEFANEKKQNKKDAKQSAILTGGFQSVVNAINGGKKGKKSKKNVDSESGGLLSKLSPVLTLLTGSAIAPILGILAGAAFIGALTYFSFKAKKDIVNSETEEGRNALKVLKDRQAQIDKELKDKKENNEAHAKALDDAQKAFGNKSNPLGAATGATNTSKDMSEIKNAIQSGSFKEAEQNLNAGSNDISYGATQINGISGTNTARALNQGESNRLGKEKADRRLQVLFEELKEMEEGESKENQIKFVKNMLEKRKKESDDEAKLAERLKAGKFTKTILGFFGGDGEKENAKQEKRKQEALIQSEKYTKQLNELKVQNPKLNNKKESKNKPTSTSTVKNEKVVTESLGPRLKNIQEESTAVPASTSTAVPAPMVENKKKVITPETQSTQSIESELVVMEKEMNDRKQKHNEMATIYNKKFEDERKSQLESLLKKHEGKSYYNNKSFRSDMNEESKTKATEELYLNNVDSETLVMQDNQAEIAKMQDKIKAKKIDLKLSTGELDKEQIYTMRSGERRVISKEQVVKNKARKKRRRVAKNKTDTSMDQMKASAERMAKYNKFKDEQMAQGKTSKEATAAWNNKQMTNYLAVEDKKNNITDTKDNENKVISDMQAQSNGVMDNSTLVKINKNLEKANKINEANTKANQKTSEKDMTIIAATKTQAGVNISRTSVNNTV